MNGKDVVQVAAELKSKGIDKEIIEKMIRSKVFTSNRFTNYFMIKDVTPL